MADDPKQTTDAGNNLTEEDLNSNIKSLLGSMENYTKSMDKFISIYKELVAFGEKSLEQDEELAKLHEKNPDTPVWMLALIKTSLAKGGEYPKVACELINRYGEAQEGVATMLQFAKGAHNKSERTDEKE